MTQKQDDFTTDLLSGAYPAVKQAAMDIARAFAEASQTGDPDALQDRLLTSLVSLVGSSARVALNALPDGWTKGSEEDELTGARAFALYEAEHEAA